MAGADTVVKLHPQNPRYLLYRGRTFAPVTAGEHYGAVVNAAFDQAGYLDMLRGHGFPLTRIFCLLREQEMEFGGTLGWCNTLAPRAADYVAPWLRSGRPGCRDGGNLFDLARWNPAYFRRLHRFCRLAAYRDIVVEITLFSSQYSDAETGPWVASPLNARNNVNGIDSGTHEVFTSLRDPSLVAVQEALARRVVEATRDLDNVYYEICNEPNPDPGKPSTSPEEIGAWHNRMIEIVADADRRGRIPHLVAVCDPNPHVDLSRVGIVNYHYKEWAFPGLERHGGTGRAVVFDETLTGIIGWNAPMDFAARRREAWEFMMRGGAGYDYLDVTVTPGDPTGVGGAIFPDGRSYSGETMRGYLAHLHRFLGDLDLASMQPDDAWVGGLRDGATRSALLSPSGEGAVYLWGNGVESLDLALAPGAWRIRVFNPRSGVVERVETLRAAGAPTRFALPCFEQDIALHVAPVASA